MFFSTKQPIFYAFRTVFGCLANISSRGKLQTTRRFHGFKEKQENSPCIEESVLVVGRLSRLFTGRPQKSGHYFINFCRIFSK